MLREDVASRELGLSLGAATPSREIVLDAGSADTIRIPDAHLMFQGEYRREGFDLVIEHETSRIVLSDYFRAAKRATLESPDGARLTEDVVSALATDEHGERYAQAAPPQGQPAIGRVETVSGQATVIRNGTAVVLNQGDPVFRGDVVQTDRSSSLGISFIDGSTFSLGADARMVLNEMVYQPGGTGNSALLNIVQGSVTFLAGQVAKSGEMRVGTPVATMGIRGTLVNAEINADNGNTRFSVLREPNGEVGRYELIRDGRVIATVSAVDQVTIVSPSGLVSTEPKSFEQQQAEALLVQQIFQIQSITQANPLIPGTGPTGPGGGGGGGGGGGSSTDPNLNRGPLDGGGGIGGVPDPQAPPIPNAPAGPAPSGQTPGLGGGSQGGAGGGGQSGGPAGEPNTPPPAPPPPAAVSGQTTGAVLESGGTSNDEAGEPTASGDVDAVGPDGAQQAFAAVASPAASDRGWGTFTVDSAGRWFYQLDDTAAGVQALKAGETATDTFTVRTESGQEQVITVTIQGADDDPVARDDAAFVTEGESATMDVLANDSDPEGGPLTVVSVEQPEHGLILFNPDGTLTYTPFSGYSGPDSFTYTVEDATGRQSTAVVSIVVGVANHHQVGGDVFLQGNYMEIGVSAAGSLGTANSSPDGFHPRGSSEPGSGPISYVVDLDGFTTGAPPAAGDFTLPGTPEDSMVVGFNGRNYVQDERGAGANDFQTTTTDTSSNGRLQSTTTGMADGLAYRQVIDLDPNATYYVTTITLTNTTSQTMTGVRFMRSFDPDQDVDKGGSYSTINDVLANPGGGNDLAVVQALGAMSGVSVNLVAFGPNARASSFGFTNHDVYDPNAYASPNDPNGGNSDSAITMTGDFGDLAPGQSVTFTYYTSLNGRAAANDMAIGSNGADTIDAGAGHDIILGLGGDDILTGGVGNDTFVFSNGLGGNATITDFTAGAGTDDAIQLRGYGFQSLADVRAQATEVADGTIINLGPGGSLKLVGVSLSALHGDDFILV